MEFSYFLDMADMGAGFAAIYAIYSLLSIGFAVGVYVLRALSLHTIAKRRGIHNPWFAWIPVVDQYLLGCISDQYQYVVHGKNKSKRIVLLVLNIVIAVVDIVLAGFGAYMVANTVSSAMGGMREMQMVKEMLGMVFVLLIIALVLLVVVIVKTILRYIAMYDLYTSCDPRNNTTFLLLNIFFPIVEPFFLFACRNKDEGMPPRRAEPVYQPPEEPCQPNWE